MKERPILFQGAMVRAVLRDVDPKTQTRRLVKGFALEWLDMHNGFNAKFVALPENHLCPYGQPGDRLWVREAFRVLDCWDKDSPAKIGDLCLNAGYPKPWAPTQYEADGARDNWMSVGTIPGIPKPGKLRPGIHMPRWASRITLEITDVRVERLQDISTVDVIAEGTPDAKSEFPVGGTERYSTFIYRRLWESINGPGTWAANPWVWVLEFKVVTP